LIALSSISEEVVAISSENAPVAGASGDGRAV
jgi:hypothetical protein